LYHQLPTAVSISRAEIFYLKEPIFWHYGIEKTSTDTLTVSSIVIVVSETVVYNGTTYLLGNEITIVAGHTSITSGIVLDNYTTGDISSVLHEDIARNSAIDLLVSIKDFEKVKMMKEMFD
jgi:PKD repeat protein